MKQKNLFANPKRKFSPAQIAAQKRFAAMAKAGKFRKRKKAAKRNPRGFSNIEKSGFTRGEYVGYGGGAVFRIRRGQVEGWKAIENDGPRVLYGKTLAALSAKLSALNSEKKNPVKPGARRSPPKRNPVDRYVIRGTKKTKTGYLHYYLAADRFLSDFMNADRYNLEDGEKKMRAILHMLPREIDTITLVKAR